MPQEVRIVPTCCSTVYGHTIILVLGIPAQCTININYMLLIPLLNTRSRLMWSHIGMPNIFFTSCFHENCFGCWLWHGQSRVASSACVQAKMLPSNDALDTEFSSQFYLCYLFFCRSQGNWLIELIFLDIICIEVIRVRDDYNTYFGLQYTN
jgi:hypothetical protein